MSTPTTEAQSLNKDPPALQKHVAFFDRDHDGVIYPLETFKGLRALGFGYVICFAGMLFINGGLSYKTLESRIPSLRFPIYIRNIHKGKHPSDSDIYDESGRFDNAQFERLFSTFASNGRKMSFEELMKMLKSRKESGGWIAAQAEWRAAFLLLKDKDGYISKEDLKGLYDGTIFYTIEKRNKEKR